MTKIEKIRYLRIALNLQGIGVNNEIADRVIETYEKVQELKGKFTIKDAVDIEMAMNEKYAKMKLEDKEKL